MLLFFKSSLGMLLLLAPLYTQWMALGAHDWEKKQIGVDNAAIELGRADRALLNTIHSTNKELAKLDEMHHAPHACRALPKCAALDKVLENTIRLNYLQLSVRVRSAWKANTLRASIALGRIDTGYFIRRADYPFQTQYCKLCRLPIALKPSGMLTSAFVGDRLRDIGVVTKPIFIADRWNYVLSVQ